MRISGEAVVRRGQGGGGGRDGVGISGGGGVLPGGMLRVADAGGVSEFVWGCVSAVGEAAGCGANYGDDRRVLLVDEAEGGAGVLRCGVRVWTGADYGESEIANGRWQTRSARVGTEEALTAKV